MSKFTTSLIVEVPLDGGDRVLVEQLVYYSSLLGHNIVVKAGMKTDYGSIPRVLHSVISPTGKPTYGFVVHDDLYQRGIYTKSVSDKVLEEANKILGVSWIKRKTITTGFKRVKML